MELHNFMPEMNGFNLYDNLIDLTELNNIAKRKAVSANMQRYQIKISALIN